MDKKKIVKNSKILSTNGFLLNTIIIINKIFFKEYGKGTQNENNDSNFILKVVGNIETLFTLSKELPFDKFDRTNPEIVENVLNENQEIEKNFQKYKNEKEMFSNKLPSKEDSPNDANNLAVISSGTNNIEIKNLSDAVKTIFSLLGYYIKYGMKINEKKENY